MLVELLDRWLKQYSHNRFKYLVHIICCLAFEEDRVEKTGSRAFGPLWYRAIDTLAFIGKNEEHY